ncbi:MAG: Mur ligase family protein [Bacteroidetes bacterium]|nr:Mur ligase family protein [Bacteroidota bacterium]MDA0879208.1 Mur ligase family protein [Bacteroidota bacterium]MDA1116361.1 Mur ligase family protein [Bacteroidota bacterium]
MRVHFIAIGGAAMHNLAIALHLKGDEVSGSDDAIFDPSLSRLKKYGLLPETMGWFPEKLDQQLDAIILGMHAKPNNPELMYAQELGLKIYSYPEYIFEQSKNKTRVVIGGSHGKTTITAMILHVLHYHNKGVDFMVGAQLEGFEVMVQLTNHNDFILLEGDEYLSSPIDRRPKFHWYRPNVALISGIAWDHINVFPTFDSYVEQFRLFIDTMVPGGSLIYNAEDEVLTQLVEQSEQPIRKLPYVTSDYSIENGQTLLQTSEGLMPIELFGAHNLSNLSGAKWICQQMGIDEDDFFEAVASFKGASKRLERLAISSNGVIFKDFAHAPSKVAATTQAVRDQFSSHHFVACLELHTFSSLNPNFIDEYAGALDPADLAIVYYTPQAVALKGLEVLSEAQIAAAFKRDDLVIFTDPIALSDFLLGLNQKPLALLMMSSGNYGGLDLSSLKALI